MKTATRSRISSHIADLDLGFDAADVAATIRYMETRATQPLDEIVFYSLDEILLNKDYSTLLLAACRYTAALKGQEAARVELEAATANLITL
jgi:hypothetical protein